MKSLCKQCILVTVNHVSQTDIAEGGTHTTVYASGLFEKRLTNYTHYCVIHSTLWTVLLKSKKDGIGNQQ